MSRILFLHGASSSGKTTLARAVRQACPHPFIQMSFDTFRDTGALRPSEHDWHVAAPKVFSALHLSFAAFADAGLDLIVEHILDRRGWRAELQALFAAHDVFFVGIQTPVVVLCAREAARGNRQLGSAAQDAATIHAGLTYDLVVDGTAGADMNAEAILSTWAKRQGRSRFFEAP